MSSDSEFVLSPERGPESNADDRNAKLESALPIIVDGFEMGTLSAYRGDTERVKASTDHVRRGTYSLEATPEPGTTARVVAHEGTRPLSRGYAYRYWYQPTQGARVRLELLTSSDGTGGYAIVHDRARQEYVVRRREPEATTLMGESTAATPRRNGWYHQDVCFTQDGSIIATLFAPNDQVLARVLAQDSMYTEGYHGFAVANRPAHVDRLVRVPL